MRKRILVHEDAETKMMKIEVQFENILFNQVNRDTNIMSKKRVVL